MIRHLFNKVRRFVARRDLHQALYSESRFRAEAAAYIDDADRASELAERFRREVIPQLEQRLLDAEIALIASGVGRRAGTA